MSRLQKFVVLSGLLLCLPGAADAVAIRYVLEEGSTIQRYFGEPYGGVEPLRGFFVWEISQVERYGVGFRTLDLGFDSPTIHLRWSPLNESSFDRVSVVWHNRPDGQNFAALAVVVDATGLSCAVCVTSTTNGQWTGSPYAPDTLIFSDDRVVQYPSGYYFARIHLYAARVVPEPGTSWLMGLGLLGLALGLRRLAH